MCIESNITVSFPELKVLCCQHCFSSYSWRDVLFDQCLWLSHPVLPTTLLMESVGLHFQRPYVSENLWYLSFCVCHFPLTRVPLGLAMSQMENCPSFFTRHSIHKPQFLHSCCNKPLGFTVIFEVRLLCRKAWGMQIFLWNAHFIQYLWICIMYYIQYCIYMIAKSHSRSILKS